MSSIQNQLTALKLNPYRELKVVSETADPPGIAAGSGEASLQTKDYATACLSFAQQQQDPISSARPAAHPAAAGSSTASQTAQFFQAVQHSVNQVMQVSILCHIYICRRHGSIRFTAQVANAPHFGMEWIKPDYSFDVFGTAPPAGQLHHHPTVDLTEEEMADLYVALEEFASDHDEAAAAAATTSGHGGV